MAAACLRRVWTRMEAGEEVLEKRVITSRVLCCGWMERISW